MQDQFRIHGLDEHAAAIGYVCLEWSRLDFWMEQTLVTMAMLCSANPRKQVQADLVQSLARGATRPSLLRDFAGKMAIDSSILADSEGSLKKIRDDLVPRRNR